MASVKHDGRETGLHTGFGAFIGAVVQVQCHRNGDVQSFDHGFYHGGDGFKTGHVFACALRNAQNHRALQLFGGQENGLGPLQVVDVELADRIVAVTGFFSISVALTSIMVLLSILNGAQCTLVKQLTIY